MKMAENKHKTSSPSPTKERILRFSCLLLSGFILVRLLFLFCFILFTPYSCKVFSFLSPVLITTLLLFLPLVTINPEPIFKTLAPNLSERNSNFVSRIIHAVLQKLRPEVKNEDAESSPAVLYAYKLEFESLSNVPQESQVEALQIQDNSLESFNGVLADRLESSHTFFGINLVSCSFRNKEAIEEMCCEKEISEKEVRLLLPGARGSENINIIRREDFGFDSIRDSADQEEEQLGVTKEVKTFKTIFEVSRIDLGSDSVKVSLDKNRKESLVCEDWDDEVSKNSIQEGYSSLQLKKSLIEDTESTELTVETKTIQESMIMDGLGAKVKTEKEENIMDCSVSHFDKVEERIRKSPMTGAPHCLDESGHQEGEQLFDGQPLSKKAYDQYQQHIESGGFANKSNGMYPQSRTSIESMKKEKEWKRTLACKLFEERHNMKGEGMDLLWEVQETDSKKPVTEKSINSSKKNRDENFGRSMSELSSYSSREHDEHLGESLCCLEALKFSTGKMNLRIGGSKMKGISKVFRGIGWLHHKVTKHSKKTHN